LLIEHPFVHPRTVKSEFSPLDNPSTYRQEFLKSVILFMAIMPLVEQGLINLFPDPCNFDLHLRDQTFGMAMSRTRGVKLDPKDDPLFMELMEDEVRRVFLLAPRESLRSQVLQKSPELDETSLKAILDGFDVIRERDPLAVLQEGSLEAGKSGGQLIAQKMAPNFEITMYIAQATGSCIVTDSPFRWRELMAFAGRGVQHPAPLGHLRTTMQKAKFSLPYDALEVCELAQRGVFRGYPNLMRRVFRYLSGFSERGAKPNVEESLNAEFNRVHASTVSSAMNSGVRLSDARVLCLWPAGGIQDNAVNRLLLMSSSEHHLASAPMALFIKM
jgi:hypothetical protein